MNPGVIATDTVLDRILAQSAIDLVERKRAVPPAELERQIAEQAHPPLSLASVLSDQYVAVISEFKRGSPSRGIFSVDLDPGSVAHAYVAGGAAAISCLTDGPFFHGSQHDLEQVAEIAHRSATPVLRKDFIVDPYQLLEARAWGADVVLLIVAALDDLLLRDLYAEANALGLSTLVEVHNEGEAERALRLEPPVVGVNNRDLKNFEVDLGTTDRVAAMVPNGTRLVSESGIFSADDVSRVAARGADAVLVGESLILQQDRAAAVRSLARVPRIQSRRDGAE